MRFAWSMAVAIVVSGVLGGEAPAQEKEVTLKETTLRATAPLQEAKHTPVALDAPAGPSDETDAKLKELLKERLAALRALVKGATADYAPERVSFERVNQARRALVQAQLESCESDKERIALLEETVALAKEFAKHAAQRYKNGAAPESDVLMAAVARLEAEIALQCAKSKVAGQTDH
jgi:hypothetical protein